MQIQQSRTFCTVRQQVPRPENRLQAIGLIGLANARTHAQGSVTVVARIGTLRQTIASNDLKDEETANPFESKTAVTFAPAWLMVEASVARNDNSSLANVRIIFAMK